MEPNVGEGRALLVVVGAIVGAGVTIVVLWLTGTFGGPAAPAFPAGLDALPKAAPQWARDVNPSAAKWRQGLNASGRTMPRVWSYYQCLDISSAPKLAPDHELADLGETMQYHHVIREVGRTYRQWLEDQLPGGAESRELEWYRGYFGAINGFSKPYFATVAVERDLGGNKNKVHILATYVQTAGFMEAPHAGG